MIGFGPQEIILFWAMFFGGFGVPVGVVPGEEDPYLHQIAPDECYMYASWSGTVPANPEGNATEKWISQKEIQDFWKQLDAELDRVVELERHFPERKRRNLFGLGELKELRPLVFRMQRLMYTQPCAMFIDNASEKGLAGNFVIKLGDMEDEIAADLNNITDAELASRNWSRVSEHGMNVVVAKNVVPVWIPVEMKFGIHNGYLLAGFSYGGKASFDTFFASEKTPEPKWLTEIKNELPVERRSSISMLDIDGVATNFKPLLDRFFPNPIAEVRTIISVTGLDSDSFVKRTSIKTEGELGPVLRVFDGDPIGTKELSRIPADKPLAIVSRMSSQEIYKMIELFANSVGQKGQFDEAVGGFDGFAGITLKEDLLDKLDDYAFIYSNKGITGPNPSLLIGIGIKDDMAFRDTIDAFSDRIKMVVDEIEGLEFNTQQVCGVSVYGVVNSGNVLFTKIFFAQSDSQLLVSTDFNMLRAQIETGENNEGVKMMMDRPDVQHLFEFGKSIGHEGPVAIVSLDLQPILEGIWSGTDQLFVDKARFNCPQFSDLNIACKDLTPFLSASYRTESGFQFYQKSVVPGGSLPATIAYLMGASLALQEAF